jgi:Domain of unknown function (DUF4389)
MTGSPTLSSYPVHVDGDLEPGLSRGLWLVKWLLVIPHYVVLAFLWLAFVVTSVLAFFSILAAGRYPRALFDFNVGVMRWSWRVSFYAYGALGTDRYPPFTLAEVPDYPAHLTVDYPERLSRGLVLVKWWLLAIPQYLVIGLFIGGLGYGIWGADDTPILSFGLLGILVLVAGVVLLFTGRYPQQVFDLVLGLNRWVLRVAGYVALMTDRYPPFSLDQGGHEGPAGASQGPSVAQSQVTTLPQPQPPPTGARTARRTGWTGGRVTLLVSGSLLVLLALGLGSAGGLLAAAGHVERDSDGYLMSPEVDLSSSSFAIASEDLDLHADGAADRVPDSVLGDVRIVARAGGASALFVGIAPTAEARAYLADVRHDTLVDIDDRRATYRSSDGQEPAGAPGDQTFWAARSTGDPDATLTWEPEDGSWTVVVMRADGSAGVDARVAAGATFPALETVVGVLLILAALALLVGAAMIAVAVHAAAAPDTTGGGP